MDFPWQYLLSSQKVGKVSGETRIYYRAWRVHVHLVCWNYGSLRSTMGCSTSNHEVFKYQLIRRLGGIIQLAHQRKSWCLFSCQLQYLCMSLPMADSNRSPEAIISTELYLPPRRPYRPGDAMKCIPTRAKLCHSVS
jgi:hypothetical protein